MAADNRNFVNKFANEGGGDVLVEDKRLEELKSATAKTSSQISTSTDYIPLQDTDGNLVKINAASFQEAVRNTLGGLLANNDKGTTISGIPALSGSGASLDFGSVSPANLASVLGDIYVVVPSNNFSSLQAKNYTKFLWMSDGNATPFSEGFTLMGRCYSGGDKAYTSIEVWHIGTPNIVYRGLMSDGIVSHWYQYTLTSV